MSFVTINQQQILRLLTKNLFRPQRRSTKERSLALSDQAKWNYLCTLDSGRTRRQIVLIETKSERKDAFPLSLLFHFLLPEANGHLSSESLQGRLDQGSERLSLELSTLIILNSFDIIWYNSFYLSHDFPSYILLTCIFHFFQFFLR